MNQMSSWHDHSGRETSAKARLESELVARFAATIGDAGVAVDPAALPLGIHWCAGVETVPTLALGLDGHPPKGGFLPPVPLPRRMWAGGSIETLAPLREGDLVTRRSRIGDVSAKEGRTGPLCFVAVDHEISTPRGLALRERHNIVYREASSLPAAAPAPTVSEPQPADLVWEVEASPVLLFRYSALTFNGHRIHYDLPYVTQEEGYDGLVVHGPIQATLMLNIAATLAGRSTLKLDYRGVSPLIAGPAFHVKARRQDDGTIRTWTEGADGRLRMEGTAKLS
jgi:3-methylfumaryl-CoA hydratase